MPTKNLYNLHNKTATVIRIKVILTSMISFVTWSPFCNIIILIRRYICRYVCIMHCYHFGNCTQRSCDIDTTLLINLNYIATIITTHVVGLSNCVILTSWLFSSKNIMIFNYLYLNYTKYKHTTVLTQVLSYITFTHTSIRTLVCNSLDIVFGIKLTYII